MKTYVAYGFVWALAGALVTLALFFLGFHSAAEKLQSAQMIQLFAGLVISVATIVLGTRARRAEAPGTEPFGYGRALATGVMITLFATIFSVIASYVYMQVINPDMQDLSVQAQIAKWEAAGMSSTQIDAAESIMRKMMHPAIQAAFGFVIGMVFGLIISLITSIFLRRTANGDQPPVTA